MSIKIETIESSILSGDVATFDKQIEKLKLQKLQQLRLVVSLIKYCEGPSCSDEVATNLLTRLHQYCDTNFIKYFYFRYLADKEAVGQLYLLFEKLDAWETHKLLNTIEYETKEGWEKDIMKNLILLLPDLNLEKKLVSELLHTYLDRTLDGYSVCEEYVEFFLSTGADINQNIGRNSHRTIMGSFLSLIDEPEYRWLIDKFLGIGGDARLYLEEELSEGGLSWFFERGINIELKPNEVGADGQTDVTRELQFPTHEKILEDLKLLSLAGADFNVPNQKGDYPLHLAVNGVITNIDTFELPKAFDVLDFILKSDIDLSVENSNKLPVLIQAVSLRPINNPYDDGKYSAMEIERLKRLINILVSHGASIDQTASSGASIFKMAEEYCPEILAFLKDGASAPTTF